MYIVYEYAISTNWIWLYVWLFLFLDSGCQILLRIESEQAFLSLPPIVSFALSVATLIFFYSKRISICYHMLHMYRKWSMVHPQILFAIDSKIPSSLYIYHM
uniref:Putative uncharacterized protein YGL042C n=1 Tax=Saccharomyces cerevisiae (strain ATCC 204508 / S288c) TaxID=559292 RepID=YGE2_YEAST|nr:RecName: Full=Putative uncharacterized protein YGL042C [Saccharomyces cerevisiae S288C]AAT93256.1 YGL042C [Saccharomyces cerevisiae]CAA96745.1 unnamed protein product [Saccharomyces cerevisiae]